MDKAIRDEIRRFVAGRPENRHPGNRGPYFEEPLVGFAAAADPLFAEYKTIIGPFHLTPGEWMEGLPGGEHGRAGTVISWILPIAKATRESNRRETAQPSQEWARTRFYGEEFNALLRKHVVDFLAGRGYRAVAPQLSPAWKRHFDGPSGISSSWSERHAAYAAGLGTFSLNGGLITAKGIAHRCGSVITDLVLSPTPRAYTDPRGYCLHYRDGSCDLCISRCPAGAISPKGQDKEKCRAYAYGGVLRPAADRYGVRFTGCGLCQTKVPCEGKIPINTSRT